MIPKASTSVGAFWLVGFHKNLKSESVETVIPHMATYEVPLLPSPNEGKDPVRTHTIIPN